MATTFLAFEKDYMSASALSTGMWHALLSTAGSLMLAIPAHLTHHFLTGRVRAIVRDVEWSGNEIMKYLLTEYRDAKLNDVKGDDSPGDPKK
jgi:biopolymer transport protein ExbB